MIYKRKGFILSLFLILAIQVLLYVNNTQKTSFRYFTWKIDEINIGKLITVSFVSGLLISTILKKTTYVYDKDNLNYDYDEKDNDSNNIFNQEEIKSTETFPPQRDIRDPQPTISVNYRVVKNSRRNNQIIEDDLPNYQKNKDDWSNDQSDW